MPITASLLNLAYSTFKLLKRKHLHPAHSPGWLHGQQWQWGHKKI